MASVLITGANRGLGLEFTRQYLDDGWTVHAAARDPGAASALKTLVAASRTHAYLHALDVADEAARAAFANAIKGEPLDVVINNAGIYGPQRQSSVDVDPDGFARTLAVNTIAPLRIAQLLKPNLKMGRLPRLVTITSAMGSIAQGGGDYYAYRASKAAVNMVMVSLAKDWKPDGITVAVLHPGWVRTDMGGQSAPLSPADSVTGLRQVIASLAIDKTGRFLDHQGQTIPW
ncbi:MAG: SDR family NAD(P)-dependent oxidoreductase [Alphaproteobacteria bacterium]|nr:SDR family NAD(P)-dependent oxidoreductase [Alphaproteobacteria bacterium]